MRHELRPTSPTGLSADSTWNPDEVLASLRQWATELGFSQIGVADVDLSSAEPRLMDWLARGFHGEMHYMASHGLKRARPAELVPGSAWALADILKRAKLVEHHKISREELSVREHMSLVLKKLQGRRFVEFEHLFEAERGVPVLVVTFIALLELAKETLIEITQAEAYAPIYVRLAYTPA